jgi:spore coat protein U-like protein
MFIPMFKPAITLFSTLLLLSGLGYADSKPASSQASMDFLPDCTISATDMDLGVYNARTGASGTSTLNIKCNSSYLVRYTGYTGKLTKGANQINYRLAFTGRDEFATGSPTPQVDRELTKDGSFQYFGLENFINFYLNDFDPPFGDITLPTGDVYAFTGSVTPNQWVSAGNYQETVVFTLDFPLNFDNFCIFSRQC